MARVPLGLALLSLLTALSAPVRGDDWLQFRHDATHSAVSQDKLHFPLKELWTWNTTGPVKHTPLYHSVIRNGWVYFTASEKKQRFLICANAKTGVVKWRQPLQAEHLSFTISDISGPAVTESGRVFVYDWLSIIDKPTIKTLTDAIFAQSASLTCSMVPSAIDCFAVRTFDAMTGKEGPYFPMAAMGANGVLPRVSLLETRAGQEVATVPPTMAGCPP
jgi:hypothetical protein